MPNKTKKCIHEKFEIQGVRDEVSKLRVVLFIFFIFLHPESFSLYLSLLKSFCQPSTSLPYSLISVLLYRYRKWSIKHPGPNFERNFVIFLRFFFFFFKLVLISAQGRSTDRSGGSFLSENISNEESKYLKFQPRKMARFC